MSEPEPVSWLMIEPGWRVVAGDGAEIGRVEEVTGDSSQDIWEGLAVATGMLARPRYVPAEQIATIVEGEVRLKLSKAEFDGLGEFEEPPTSAEVETSGAPLGTRLEADVEAPVRDRPERVPLVRRVLLWLGLRRD
jgi:hypothetical protein